ncbi:MAG: peptidylprolyl isomerase [Planctomycetales bacterium]|nr:peptidylprolyl isomerase [Planctomycetales bacterium]
MATPPKPGSSPAPIGDLEPEDKLELATRATVQWVRSHRTHVAWSLGGLALAVLLVVAWVRHHERRERDAWRAYSTNATLPALRKSVADFGGTSAGPFLRLALARALADEAEKLDDERANQPEHHAEKVALLEESLRLLTGLQREWGGEGLPQLPLVNNAHMQVEKEIAWQREWGLRYVRRAVAPKEGKSLGEIVAAPEKPRVAIVTEKGEIQVDLFEDEAQNTTANFLALAAEGFYDGLTFHRVEDDRDIMIVQGGCPKGDGSGGPGYRIRGETRETIKHEEGSIAMADSGLHTAGSQFYLCGTKPSEQTKWDGRYTVFGKVASGIEVVRKLTKGDKILEVKILRRRGTAGGAFAYQPVVSVLGPPEKALAKAPPATGK